MRGTEQLRQALTEWMTVHGVPAVCAWPEGQRAPAGKAVVAVSLRKMESKSPGFQDYLGERYDPEMDDWVEIYGKRVRLTFGLDVYAETASEVGMGLDNAAELLGEGRPVGLKMLEFSAGETTLQKDSRRYCCPAQAVFEVWAFGRDAEDRNFLDFEVRGVTK